MKHHLISIFFVCLFFLVACKDSGNVEGKSYEVEHIRLPEGVNPQIGALDFLPNGSLVVCFIRGEIMFYNPQTKEWTLFAEGLHEPLGVLAVSNTELLVMQRAELTRIKDTDGDGKADNFETVTDDFGLTGNYHEFAYGPVKDKNGDLFIALNLGSMGGGYGGETREPLDTLGKTNQGKAMFSVVPYRGWIMKLNKNDKLEPYATGFRSPNGITFDSKNNLLVTENQGDWVGTSKLFEIKEGRFYGHPAGLIWRKDWNEGNPFDLPIFMLDSLREKAAVLFPQDIIANSPTQPLVDNTRGKFGPFSNQVFVGEMNVGERLVRVLLEKVNGELQGACIPFAENLGLGKGNNRLTFSPDGSLWVGKIAYGWGGDQGLTRIIYTGTKPADIYDMKITPDGFELEFTQPLNKDEALSEDNYHFHRYNYEYHPEYGSDKKNSSAIGIKEVTISRNKKKISFALEKMDSDFVYQLDIGNIHTASGQELDSHVICYTVKNLK